MRAIEPQTGRLRKSAGARGIFPVTLNPGVRCDTFPGDVAKAEAAAAVRGDAKCDSDKKLDILENAYILHLIS
jgi:hypothetical protein